MSVVVAIRDKDRVWIGCDSQITYSNRPYTGTYPKKVWKPTDDNSILLGGVGSGREIGIMNTSTDLVDRLTKFDDKIDFSFVVRKLVPMFFDELRRFNALHTKDGVSSMESSYIFAYKNKMFLIESAGGVIETDEPGIMIGSGAHYSIGAFDMLKDESMSIQEKVSECVRSACLNNIHVDYPITIMNTLDDKVITITETSQFTTTEKL